MTIACNVVSSAARLTSAMLREKTFGNLDDDAVPVLPGEVPVFWACGVTPQAALARAKPPFAITHKPGHMFLTDLRDRDLES